MQILSAFSTTCLTTHMTLKTATNLYTMTTEITGTRDVCKHVLYNVIIKIFTTYQSTVLDIHITL